MSSNTRRNSRDYVVTDSAVSAKIVSMSCVEPQSHVQELYYRPHHRYIELHTLLLTNTLTNMELQYVQWCDMLVGQSVRVDVLEIQSKYESCT